MNETPYTIDKDLPIPAKLGRVTSPLSMALRKMEVNDSMLMTQRERNAAFAIVHKLGIKLASRRIDNEQVRVWRIK